MDASDTAPLAGLTLEMVAKAERTHNGHSMVMYALSRIGYHSESMSDACHVLVENGITWIAVLNINDQRTVAEGEKS